MTALLQAKNYSTALFIIKLDIKSADFVTEETWQKF